MQLFFIFIEKRGLRISLQSIWLILPVIMCFVSKLKPCMSQLEFSHSEVAANGSVKQL